MPVSLRTRSVLQRVASAVWKPAEAAQGETVKVSCDKAARTSAHMPADDFMFIVLLIWFHCNLQEIVKARCPNQLLSIMLGDLFMEELTCEVN